MKEKARLSGPRWFAGRDLCPVSVRGALPNGSTLMLAVLSDPTTETHLTIDAPRGFFIPFHGEPYVER